MATISVKGQEDIIHYSYGTSSNLIFDITEKNKNTGVETDLNFSLYEGAWRIKETDDAATNLYEASSEDSDPKLSFSGNTYTIDDIFDVDRGKYYFELVITDSAGDTIYKPHFGTIYIE